MQSSKSKYDLDLWPLDSKINRGPPVVIINSCVKYHYCMSKGNGTSKFRELWSPARQQIWPWSRSKVMVKVTTWHHRKGLVTKNTHAKYQSSICNSAKVVAEVKVFVTDRRTDRQRDGRTDEWHLMSPRFRESGRQQANSENCGPRLGNKFDLENSQRSRSRHGANWKGLLQGPGMPNIL